jgi:hypothetical protein
MSNHDFNLKKTTLVCPVCNSMSAHEVLVDVPEVTADTPVEADLHRVLPDAKVRAGLLAACPYCRHTWWTSSFKMNFFPASVVPPATEFTPTQKFAQAIVSGRNQKFHSLDLAVMAMNGYWSAREEGLPVERWLDLIRQELKTALEDDSWFGNRQHYQYLLGEICRLSRDFHSAVRYFNMVTPRSKLPAELVEQQRKLAIIGDHQPALMPPHLVMKLYGRPPVIAEDPAS